MQRLALSGQSKTVLGLKLMASYMILLLLGKYTFMDHFYIYTYVKLFCYFVKKGYTNKLNYIEIADWGLSV